MAIQSILRWLGLDDPGPTADHVPLRDLVQSLDRLEPVRARHLARFAYLLGRVAHADQHVSAEETAAMEAIVREQGGLTPGQAIVVVGLARSNNRLFGATADFEVARDFAAEATPEEKLALARCLFQVAASDARISVAEESELHRIANQLQIPPADLTALRLSHRRFLPGLSTSTD
jgi:uncharacterized tellurite resistance protein B-like protein